MGPSLCGQYRKVAYTLKSLWSCKNMTAGHTASTARQSWLMSSPVSCDHKVTYRAQTPEVRGWPHGLSCISPWWPRPLKGVWRQMAWVVRPYLIVPSDESWCHTQTSEISISFTNMKHNTHLFSTKMGSHKDFFVKAATKTWSSWLQSHKYL
jgi:hypothetical protein